MILDNLKNQIKLTQRLKTAPAALLTLSAPSWKNAECVDKSQQNIPALSWLGAASLAHDQANLNETD